MDLNRLGRGVYGNAFARLFGLQDVNAVPTLAPEILPTSSLWERPEFWALFGGRLGCVRFTLAAGGAGQAAHSELGLPAPSTQLLIIERIVVATAVLATWGVSYLRNFSNVAPQHRDTRMKASQGDFTSGIGATAGIGNIATGTGFSSIGGAITGPQVVPVDYVLSPGDHLVVQGPDNAAVNFTVLFRERSCAPDEYLRQ